MAVADVSLPTTVALVGGVLVIAALLSGVIERSRLPQVAVFLALGACVGPSGLGLVRLSLDGALLQAVATLALVLVLFTDALGLDWKETRAHVGLALRVLGPGTLLSAALVALAASLLLRLSVPAAIILGAAIASTDPVLLRGILRHPAMPQDARLALRLESGLNDIVLLPVLLVALIVGQGAEVQWPGITMRMLLLGPGAGVAVGLVGIAALDLIRRRTGVRRDYESLYSLGIAFVAFAAGEGLHGSGLLAAFAAGLTIVLLDVELCDCFLEYGQTTAEMALLFTFVLLGSGPIWSAADALDAPTLLFTVLVLLARPAAFLPALAFSRLDRRSRGLIAWFGPRGLSSLLLALLSVFAGIPEGPRIFSTCCLVVLASIVVHGGSALLLGRGARAREPATPSPAAVAAIVAPDAAACACPVADAPHASAPAPPSADRVSMEQAQAAERAGRVVYIDARTERSVRDSGLETVGTVRLLPDESTFQQAQALGLPKDAWLVVLCA